jgi:GMP synthase (glutamine-hydrolysing)
VREAVGSLAVVDFGGQYTHLINRTLREMGYHSTVRQVGELESGALSECAGIVLSGGPDSVLSRDSEVLAKRITGFPRPILGICFGHQLLAKILGGHVEAARAREYGLATIVADQTAALFCGLPSRQQVWMSHGDHVEEAPPGFRVTASTGSLAIAAFESLDGRLHGVQFHPEVIHTEHGRAMLQNFVDRCGAADPAGVQRLAWSAEDMRGEIIESIRREAGTRTLFLLVSGGVDSLVAMALCVQAVGQDRVRALHIDTGFMRKGESGEILDHVGRLGWGDLRVVDASERFFTGLASAVLPEDKRAIIGRLFVEVFTDSVREMGGTESWMLVQGTIYPDRIETGGTERADRIKTHHNRVEEIQALIARGRVIEPLAELYKHEVRQLGAIMGLPPGLLRRQPFPGPGLAVRVICSDTSIPPAGFNDEHSALADLLTPLGCRGTILPVRSVGVQGDARTYRHPALVWFSSPAPPDWGVLKTAAARVVNTLHSVNRVVFGLRPPEALCLGSCMLDRDTIRLLQEVDSVARQATAHLDGIWQMPVVALPLFDTAGNRAFVLRPVRSRDAMTADAYEMDGGTLDVLDRTLRAIPGVAEVFYDVTTKPPGTIEWE